MVYVGHLSQKDPVQLSDSRVTRLNVERVSVYLEVGGVCVCDAS